MSCVIASLITKMAFCDELASAEKSYPVPISILVADSRDVEAYKSHQPINVSTATIALALEQSTMPLNFEYASMERSDVLMKERGPFCATNRLKTVERASQYLFSNALNLFLNRRIYQHASAPPLADNLLDEQGRIKWLADIFRSYPDKIVILPTGVAYKKPLAEQIAALSQQNIYYREGGNLFQIPMMFEKGRGDFLFEYPAIVYELFNESVPLRSYQLSSNDEYSHGHLMCTDTPETRQLLEQINKRLEMLYQDGSLLRAHLHWLPESDHQAFTQLFRKVFDNKSAEGNH